MATKKYSQDSMTALICRIIYNLFEKHAEPDSDLKEDLELDSLDRMDILVDVEKELGYEENELSFNKEQQKAFASCKTPSDLAKFFLEIYNARLQ